MLLTKRRLIHATIYEVTLLVIIALVLSHIFEMPLEVTGGLGVLMAVTSMIWNMVFNHYFEKAEAKYGFKRTVKVRILHAIGFEGGLTIATIPMIAYFMQLSFLNAMLLDFSLTLCILFYTFIFQCCYDYIEESLDLQPEHRKI